MCAEKSYSQSIQTKFTKIQQTFKHLTAQCGFLTRRSDKGCVGKVDILCVVHVQESHSLEAEVLTQQGSTGCCYNSRQLNILQEAWKVTRCMNLCMLIMQRWTIAHVTEFKTNKWGNDNSRWGDLLLKSGPFGPHCNRDIFPMSKLEVSMETVDSYICLLDTVDVKCDTIISYNKNCNTIPF